MFKFFPLVLFSALLPAQSTQFGGLLVGNTGPSTLAASLAGHLYTQEIGTCQAAVSRGTTLRMALNGGGGAAYDAARQAVWLSDGADIVLKDIGTGAESCRFKATLTTGGRNNPVTGLAHSNRRRQLIQMETFATAAGSSLAFRFYDTSQCPPVLLPTTCAIPIPRGNTPGTARGLAYDEYRDLIFFSTSLTGFAGVSNSVNYVGFALACLNLPLQAIPVPRFGNCGGSNVDAVSGLAYDSCSQILYATEGNVTLGLDLKDLANPVNLNANKPCCKFGVTRQVWAGLAYVPKSKNQPVGTSCLSANCSNCSNMNFEVVGDLVLGNQEIAFELTGGPGGGMASFYISLGKCTSGFGLPGLCGAIHPSLASGQPLLLGSFAIGGATCAGALRLPTAVPLDLALCGADLCAQLLIVCPTGSGAGLTNAVEFRVGG